MAKANTDHRVRVGAERRRRMLAQLSDAALCVMAQKGPDLASVDAIVQAAGVSRGTFYKYYEAPSDLVRAVGAELAQDLILTLAPVLDRYEDPAERLTAAFRSTLQLARKSPLLAKFLIRAGWPAVETVPAFSERAARNLADGMTKGRFRRMPMPLAIATVAGISIGVLAAQAAPESPPNLEEEATTALLMALGVNEAEARSLAKMPMAAPMHNSGGILARTLGLA